MPARHRSRSGEFPNSGFRHSELGSGRERSELSSTDDNASAISLQDGTYLIVHRAGTITVTAEASGYTSLSYSGVITSENETMSKDFGLVPLEHGDDSGGGGEDSEDEGGEDGSQDGGGEDDGEGEGSEGGGEADGSGTLATSSGGGDSDGSCFIATAAYGSAMEPFRERFMFANTAGEAFVHLYYSYSTPVADFIARHDTHRAVVRWSLLPLLGASWMDLHFDPEGILVLLVLLLALMSATTIVLFRTMRRKKKMDLSS